MKTCPTCHKDSPDNASVCPFCGTPFSAAQPYFQGGASPPQHPQGAPPQAPYGGPYQQAQYGYGAPYQQAQYGYGAPQQPYAAQQPAYGHPQGAYPPQGVYPQQLGEVSPKKRNIVILLNFFLGAVGAHRFYLGKIITGILMLLTLGGLFIWSFVDLVISSFGNYKDSKGRFVDRRCSKAMAVVFVVLYAFSLVAMPFVLVAGVGVPQYAKYRRGAMDSAVQTAYRMVMAAENAYLQENGEYATDYGELERKAYLQRDPNVGYGPIELVENKTKGTPGYRFTVRYMKDPTIAYEVDTSSDMPIRRLSK